MFAAPALAGPDAFKPGKTIPEFGKIAAVQVDQPLYRHQKFKVVFDVSKQAELGELNRNLNSVARFINMHTEAGIKKKNIKLAVVLHGGAAKDVTRASYYRAHAGTDKTDKDNANAALVKALIANNVEFYVCGQTAAYYDIRNEDLLPGVKMALSAMTAHALLQQKGYTLNPF
ncbi:MAG TPA: hypothetical protein ENJ42_06970 [Hellea balneolensis]|uniref:Uncharacterized protein n=1 Tax=Hellea balneolensis TaxID=287478 RepID=A0A7C5QWT1_9PROT|nr:hypothetical protein [Hellea balneolensis]